MKIHRLKKSDYYIALPDPLMDPLIPEATRQILIEKGRYFQAMLLEVDPETGSPTNFLIYQGRLRSPRSITQVRDDMILRRDFSPDLIMYYNLFRELSDIPEFRNMYDFLTILRDKILDLIPEFKSLLLNLRQIQLEKLDFGRIDRVIDSDLIGSQYPSLRFMDDGQILMNSQWQPMITDYYYRFFTDKPKVLVIDENFGTFNYPMIQDIVQQVIKYNKKLVKNLSNVRILMKSFKTQIPDIFPTGVIQEIIRNLFDNQLNEVQVRFLMENYAKFEDFEDFLFQLKSLMIKDVN